jgi:hypothetical protein
LIPAQALNTLDSDEARSLEEHLTGCAECRAELDDVQSTFASIALSVTPIDPPAELRSRILEIAKTTPQEPKTAAPVERPTASPDDGYSSSNVVPLMTKAPLTPLPARRKSGSRAIKLLALAASVAFVVAAIGLFLIWNREKSVRGQLILANNRLKETELELARERGLRQMLASPDSRISQLQGTDNAPNATGKLAVDRNTGRAVLLAYNLPPPPAGKEYQLWYIADGKPLPGRTFKTDAKGNGEALEVIPAEGRNAAVFAVTLESAGGASAPTSAPYLQGPGA